MGLDGAKGMGAATAVDSQGQVVGVVSWVNACFGDVRDAGRRMRDLLDSEGVNPARTVVVAEEPVLSYRSRKGKRAAMWLPLRSISLAVGGFLAAFDQDDEVYLNANTWRSWMGLPSPQTRRAELKQASLRISAMMTANIGGPYSDFLRVLINQSNTDVADSALIALAVADRARMVDAAGVDVFPLLRDPAKMAGVLA